MTRLSIEDLRFAPAPVPATMSEPERVGRVGELRTAIIAIAGELRALWRAGLPLDGSMGVLDASWRLREADIYLADAQHEFANPANAWAASWSRAGAEG